MYIFMVVLVPVVILSVIGVQGENLFAFISSFFNMSAAGGICRRLMSVTAWSRTGVGTKINRPISDYQVATEDGSSLGVAIVKAMSEALDQSGVDLRLETEAIDILQESDKSTGTPLLQ